jgi:hypothetical protein
MFETRKQNLAARARKLTARLDDIQSSGKAQNRDLTWHERREVDRCRDEARELQKKAQDIRADEEIEEVMNDLGNGIHKGKGSAPKTGGATIAFKETDLRTMHSRAIRRLPMKLLSRTESPMSNQLDYWLPPFDFPCDTFRLLDHLPVLNNRHRQDCIFLRREWCYRRRSCS